MAVNEIVYKWLIKDPVLPFINQHHSDGNYKFWPDLESLHYAAKVVEYYRAQKIKFVEKCENPDNANASDSCYNLKSNSFHGISYMR